MLRFLALSLLCLPAVAQPGADWQQEVAYSMDVRLDTERHRLSGRQHLVYTNHSPDTLRHVYYHLYFNAFQPGSAMAEHARTVPDPSSRLPPDAFDLRSGEIGFQRIESLTQDGAPAEFRIEDTVLEVDLAAPLLPGQATTLAMTFEAQVPVQIRRSGRDSREGIDYTMTQWYPKMAAYDARGWHTPVYIGREFYGPFGTFDVRITLPADYVVGATGVLQNPEAVGHGYDQPPDMGLTTSGPARSDSLTWDFHAANVHDFAWSADPDYRHAQYLIEGAAGRDEPVALHLLYQPDIATSWEPASGWTTAILRFFSAQYGTYAYPQFTIAQAGDSGMEYPMFTAITAHRTPTSLFYVIAHELAHMWFYGMVGTDETSFAWMDEGFSEYATAEAVARLQSGGTATADHGNARQTIVRLQHTDRYEPPNTPSNDFATNAAYNAAAYDSGRALLDLLGYVMGDAARDAFLQAYVERFRFAHPTPDDVRHLAEEVSGLRLGWLFGPFLDEGARYDYAAEALEVDTTASGYRASIMLHRREAGVLPVALLLRYDDGSEERVTIPVAEAEGAHALEGECTAEPWSATETEYTLLVEGANPVREVILDPDKRMLDLDITNNWLGRVDPENP